MGEVHSGYGHVKPIMIALTFGAFIRSCVIMKVGGGALKDPVFGRRMTLEERQNEHF